MGGISHGKFLPSFLPSRQPGMRVPAKGEEIEATWSSWIGRLCRMGDFAERMF